MTQQAIQLLIFGMGTVIVFLCLLVLCTGSMSALLSRFASASVNQPVNATAPAAALPPVSARTVAILQRAIDAHRRAQTPDDKH